MKKVELLLPAGNIECLRAAVANGADAVYLGMSKFNARSSAGNFDEDSIFSVIEFCHKHDVKVYITFNTLIKNSELEDFFSLMNTAYSAGADAFIIQDPCFIPLIKKNFPKVEVHLSTQGFTTNSYSIPDGADRVVLARELNIDEIRMVSKKVSAEVFIHGALCFSYSGQCLFSSIVGGRSGNRGSCAQPCRKCYNNRYPLSTKDLCLVEMIPEMIRSGISSFKVEGRMRSPLYVGTVARIYRKYIDLFYDDRWPDKIDENDLDDLMIVFNREFTKGFAFDDIIVDAKLPMNRGLYLGRIKDKSLKLKKYLKVGDGIGIWVSDKVIGHKIEYIKKDGQDAAEASAGDVVQVDFKGAPDGSPVYKTSSVDLSVSLGDEIPPFKPKVKDFHIKFSFQKKPARSKDHVIIAKVSKMSEALDADKAGADIIYYDITKEDCLKVKDSLKNAKFFVFFPRALSDNDIALMTKKLQDLKPHGVLVGNRGLLPFVKDYEVHLDYSFNCFNDLDLSCYKGLPIISPELNFSEISSMKNKNFITLVHGNIILMATKNRIAAPEIVDEEKRKFRVRHYHNVYEILNNKQLGLFNKAKLLSDAGIRYFLIEVDKDSAKFIRIYRKILSGQKFDDSKIKKGFTTGHFDRGVS